MNDQPASEGFARRWGRKLTVVFATGYILFFWSERVFWSFMRPGDKVWDLLLTWVVYSLLAWIFLLLVRQCRVAAFPALFLAAAVYGWLAEGVVVDTLYGNEGNPFPASISFTGLAWHAAISVGLGWYAQARVLARDGWRPVVGLAVAAGLGWGLWAGWWPAELGRDLTAWPRFAAHSFAVFIPLWLAWGALGWVEPGSFRPARFELPILLALAALFFGAVRVPATPRSALILPPLLLACGWALWRNRARTDQPDLLSGFGPRLHRRNFWFLPLMPAAAVAVYAPVASLGWTLPSNWVVYIVTMPLGFFLLVRSLVLLLAKPSPR